MQSHRPMVAFAVTLAMGVVTSVASYSQGPEKPVAVVSIAPVDRLMQDFIYLMRTCGVPQVGGLGSMMTKQYTQGLDPARPAGVIVQLVDGQPVPLAFLPLENREQFFSALAGAGLIPDDLSKGLYAFDAGGRTIYAKEVGKWLFVSQQEDDFAKLPADPAALLGDSPTKYDLAVRVNLQALPPDLRNMAVSQMKVGFERSLAEQRGQSDEEKAAAEELGKASIAQMERMLNETEQVLIGWNAAASTQKLQIDLGAQFVSGSELAQQVDKLQGLTSDFTGLLIEGAAFTLRSTSMISESDKAMAKSNLRNAAGQLEKKLSEGGSDSKQQQKDALTKFVRGIVPVIEKTIDGGKFDGGGAVALNDGKIRAVFGAAVADGAQVEKQIKDLVASLGSGPDVPKVQFNYAKHQNVNLHKVSIPVKTDNSEVQKIFGSQLQLVLGTGEKSVFLSLDPSVDTVIKSGLDRVATTKNVKVKPGEMIAEVGQILTFAQSLAPSPILDSATQMVQQAEGRDKIRVLASAVTRGLLYQIIVEEGVLKGIGAAVQAGQGSGRPGF